MDARSPGKPRNGDAFGQALLDYLEHEPDGRAHIIICRPNVETEDAAQ